MASAVVPGDYPQLRIKSGIVDNSLLLTPNTGQGISLRRRPPAGEGEVVASIGFRTYIGFAVRIYLARRGEERLFVQFSSTGPSRDGIFLERRGDTSLLLDTKAVMNPSRRAPYLRFDSKLGAGALRVELNGASARVALPGKGWQSDLEVRPVADRGGLMVEDVAFSAVATGGAVRTIVQRSFSYTPVLTDLGRPLVEGLGRAQARVIALLLLLLAAALVDLLLLWLHGLGWLGRLGLSPMGWLTLTWPAEVLLLYLARAGLRLPYLALAAAVGITLLARYMGLAGAGVSRPVERGLPRWMSALLFGAGLALLGLAVWTQAWPSWLLAAAPPVLVLAAAAVGRALPPWAWILFVLQGAGGVLLFTPAHGMTADTWLALAGIPLVLSALVHVLKGQPRGGWAARVLVAAGACVALLLFLELGLARIKGVSQHVVVKEGGHRANLKSGLHGDPLGKLRGADEVEVQGRRYKVAKPPGSFRLVCLGSSSTAGAGTDEPALESYPARLQQQLKKQGQARVQVINADIDGASLTQLKVYLEEVLLHLKPDLILLYFGANMDRHEARTYYKELRELLAGAPHVRTADQLWAARQMPYNSAAAIALFLKLQESTLFGLTRGMVNMAVEGTLDEDERISEEIPSVIPETVRELVALCRRHRLPIVLVPEVLRTAILEPENKDAEGIRGRTFHYTDLFRALAKKYRTEGVRYVSVHGAYTPDQVRNSFVDEMHQNRVGYRRLARALLAALTEEGLLPAAASRAP